MAFFSMANIEFLTTAQPDKVKLELERPVNFNMGWKNSSAMAARDSRLSRRI
jgi:hypothetical protein